MIKFFWGTLTGSMVTMGIMTFAVNARKKEEVRRNKDVTEETTGR